MTFREEIELQIRDNKMLSYEILSNLKDKNYYSGKPKQVGETVLFGYINEEDNGEKFTKLITFHEDEIGELYDEDFESYSKLKTDKLPRLKKL